MRNGTYINNGFRRKNGSEMFNDIRNNQPNVNTAGLMHATETQHGTSIQFRKNVNKEV